MANFIHNIFNMAVHPSKEKTFVIIKPDGVQRALVGEIIQRLEKVGLKIIALKMVLPTEDQCWTHYNKDDAWFKQKGERTIENRKAMKMKVDKSALEYGKDIVRALVKFMTAGPVVAMVLSGNQAVGIVKKLVGGTEPLTSDVGTIRGDLTLDSYELSSLDERAVRNLIHCSDKPEEAEREIDIWFKPEELIGYRQIQEEILYDVNLDGILE
ncbi:MAG: nucleoside-diphosphate kinase [Patescibacteria group bacterium]